MEERWKNDINRFYLFFLIDFKIVGFPCGPGNLPGPACQSRGHRFDLFSRKIPHISGQLDPWATTTKTTCPRACAPQKRNHCNEKPTHCNEE